MLKVAATEREFGNYFFYKQCFKIAKDRYKRVWHQENVDCDFGKL